MDVQTLLPYSPFLAVVFLLYAFVQALRKQKQGIGALLLMFSALAAPFAILLTSQDAAVRTALAGYLFISAVVTFVGSILISMIESGTARKTGRSYAMVGVSLGVLLAGEMLLYNMVIAPNTTSAAGTTTSAGVSAFITAVTEQTGLTSDAITTQTDAGQTIAALVQAHNGDVKVVISAAAAAIDELKTQASSGTGFGPARLLSSLGDDSTAVATQFVNGELDSRPLSFLTRMMLSGGGGFPAGGAPPNGTPGAGFDPANAPAGFGAGGGQAGATGGQAAGSTTTQGNAQPVAVTTNQAGGAFPVPNGTPPVGFDPANAPAGFGAGAGGSGQAAQATPAPTVTPLPTLEPTDVVVRPTLISFPSATPTPNATQAVASGTTATAEAVSAMATCTVTPIYNLNLREQPNTEGRVYLSIPYGTGVTADARTRDEWYHVSYNGQAGWVSGEYLAKDAACAKIALSDGG